MARNKYPEQTINRILEVATKLFIEKGYENTSVQDILNELGNLTKGAIYHHFKSKEDIFDAVASKMGESNFPFWEHIIQNNQLNGSQKLREFVRLNISSIATKNIIDVSPNLLNNPKLLSIQIKHISEIVTPKYIAPIITLGVEDGSIKTDTPYELAEAITLLINVWLNPLILGGNKEQLPIKCKVINEFLSTYNLILFDDDLINKLSKIKNNCSN